METLQNLSKEANGDAKKQRATLAGRQFLSKKMYKNQLQREAFNKQFVKRLSATTLQFSGRERALDLSYLRQLAAALNSARDTRKLNLDCPYIIGKISPNNLSYFGQSLKHFRSLQVLNLRFLKSSEEPDVDLQHIGQSLKALVCLQSLILSVGAGYYSDIGLKYLSQGIKRLLLLKKLELSFQYLSDVTSKGFCFVGQSLKRLVCLEEVSLNFSDCLRMDDFGLFGLSRSFNKLCSVKSFSLEVRFCSEITDEGLVSLSKGLGGFLSLQNFSLEMTGCPEITDQGLNSLSEALKRHVHLKYLWVNFEGCIKITDEAVRNFSEILMIFISLEEFYFDVSGCLMVTKEEVDFMVGILEEEHPSQVVGVLRFESNSFHFIDRKIEQQKSEQLEVNLVDECEALNSEEII